MFSPRRDPTAPGTKSPFGTWVQPSSWSHFPGHPQALHACMIQWKSSQSVLSNFSLSPQGISFFSLSLLATSSTGLCQSSPKGHLLWALSSQIIPPFQAQSPRFLLLSFPLRICGAQPVSPCTGHSPLTHHCPDLKHACLQSHHEGPWEKDCAWLIYVSQAPLNIVDIQSLVLYQFNEGSPHPDLSIQPLL